MIPSKNTNHVLLLSFCDVCVRFASGSLLFVVLIFPFQLHGQHDFRKGFVITTTNDTLQGEIAYNTIPKDAQICFFRKNETSEQIKYTPNEIKGFRFDDDDFYVSRNIERANSTEILFLEYLVNGVVSVYCYNDGEDHFFIEESDHQLKELKQETRKIYKGDVAYSYEYKPYIGLLKNSMAKSATISKKAETISLSHKSLISLATAYHYEVCPAEKCTTYEKQLPKTPWIIGLLVGASGTTIQYNTKPFVGGTPFYVADIDLGTKYSPVIGLTLSKALTNAKKGVSVRYEATYSKKITFKGSTEREVGIYTFHNNVMASWASFNNTVLIRYTMLGGKLVPHAGISYNFISQSNFQSDWYGINSSGETVDPKSIKESLFSKLYGPLIGIGFEKVVSVDVRYQLLAERGRGEFVSQFSINLYVPLLRIK